MKNIFKISFAFALLALTASCDDDDDVNFVQPNYLAGKWVPVETGSLNDENILDYLPYENDSECDLDYLRLNEDFSFSFTDFHYNGTTCESEVLEEGKYRKDGRTLILTTTEEIDGVPTEVETIQNLISLTYDTMEVSYTDADTGELTFIKFAKSE